MGTRLSDSAQYAHLWGTAGVGAGLRGARAAADMVGHPAALATAQARLGMIPTEAATAIADARES